MKPNKKNLEKKILSKLSKILSLKPKDLIEIDDFRKIENWDSLKHLEIITVLDDLLNKKLKKVKNPNQLTSIKKIISLI
tara:strand:+ start:518 stop:754 length:237 start_codon:yes stop_codon:yes gene_type:complete